MSIPQAMVLAAGLGTRLWPLTQTLAKPAVPFLGRPLIDWVMAHLARHGIEHAVVNTHHLPGSVTGALDLPRPHGIDVKISHEDEILGTAGCLARARDEGLLDPERATLIINAKLFTDLDLSAAIETHERSGASVTMVLYPNRAREAFREVYLREGRVVGFGATRDPETDNPLLFTGIHILAPSVLKRIPTGFSDTIRDVYPPLIEAGSVAAHVSEAGRWWEFSTIERYLALHQRAADEGLGPAVHRAPGAEIHAGAEVARSVLWPGAQVRSGARVFDSVLGHDVVIPADLTISSAAVVRRSSVDEEDRPGRAEGNLWVVPLKRDGP